MPKSSYDEAKEANAMIADMTACVLTAVQNPRADLATPSQPFNIEPIGIAIPANDERFRNPIETKIDTFESTGVLDTLRNEWLEGGDWVRAPVGM